jgi:nicotinate-nucleotide adenylyltransferase
MTMNVGIFGGSFNPPHVAHVLACALVLSVEDVEAIVVVPTYKHPFAKPLAPFDDRVRMCELAMAKVGDVQVSRVEQELGGESRTLRTLEHIAAANPDWKLRLIVGADILSEGPRWFGFEAIGRIAPLIVLGRAGVTAPDGVPRLLPEVSSTDIRSAIERGAWSEVEKLLPRSVLWYIRARGLYAAPL